MHPNSLLVFDKFALPLFRPGHRVLEIGPDGTPSTLQARVGAGDRSIQWETLDIDEAPPGAPKPTFLAHDPYTFPLADGLFDVVLSANVIEHVPKVWRWVPELARVCKPGGRVITIAPVSWPYHEAPQDCWRIYPAGMEALYQDAGLRVETSYWGSLEFPGYQHRVPGAAGTWGPRGKLKRAARRLLGLPVVCAFDTVVVGVK